MVVPEPADLLNNSGKLSTGVGSDPAGPKTPGPRKMDPPPVDIVTESLSGRVIVSPTAGAATTIAVPVVPLEVNEEPAPMSSTRVPIDTLSVPESSTLLPTKTLFADAVIIPVTSRLVVPAPADLVNVSGV